jgi:hypothetical protein
VERQLTRPAPRLSIVVLSQGDVTQLKKALRVVLPAAADMGAQTIVVMPAPSRAADLHLAGLGDFTMVHAPAGSTRSELCDRAMQVARGDIVLLRNAGAIKDASWIQGRIPRQVEPPAPARAIEREVTTVVEPLADVARARPGAIVGADDITIISPPATGLQAASAP